MPSPVLAIFGVGLIGLTAACGSTVESSNLFGTGNATTPATSGRTSQSADETADDDGVEKLDVHGGATGAGPGDVGGGCQKIDFLFIVDNSGSMEDEQQNLVNSFPGFMSTINKTLEASFYHVMAISTDNGEGSGSSTSCSNGVCDCVPAPLCCENACGGIGVSCNGFDCDDLPITECDRSWGTGRIYDSAGNHCAIDDDRRYMLHTQADLDTTFACSANVGVYGNGAEKPMLAMGYALSDEINAADGCNQGFLRDDAILVVTLITDEEDDNTDASAPGSPGDPPDWIATLVEAKGGNPDAVVFLALVGDSNLPAGQCAAGGAPGAGTAGAEAAPRLQAVAQGLPFGAIGSVCAPDYTPFFEQAVSVIDASCEIFEPEG